VAVGSTITNTGSVTSTILISATTQPVHNFKMLNNSEFVCDPERDETDELQLKYTVNARPVRVLSRGLGDGGAEEEAPFRLRPRAPSPTRANGNVHGRAAWERFCDWSDMRGYRKKMSGGSSGGHPRSGRSPLR